LQSDNAIKIVIVAINPKSFYNNCNFPCIFLVIIALLLQEIAISIIIAIIKIIIAIIIAIIAIITIMIIIAIIVIIAIVTILIAIYYNYCNISLDLLQYVLRFITIIVILLRIY
jgi:hypothetical protein